MNQISLKNIKKDVSSRFKLGAINLEISSPSCFCLFGGNGSGKSTFFRLLTGNQWPDSGSIHFGDEVLTYENFALKRQLGYLPQNLDLPKWSTGEQILSYGASLYEIPHAKQLVLEILEYWDCLSYKDRPLANCSHGMQKRIGLALSHLHNPDYLILDEPFTGLDLEHIFQLESLLTKRKNSGKITILSTHLAPYAAKLCSHAALLKGGKLELIEGWEESSYDEKMNTIRRIFRGKTSEGASLSPKLF